MLSKIKISQISIIFTILVLSIVLLYALTTTYASGTYASGTYASGTYASGTYASGTYVSGSGQSFDYQQVASQSLLMAIEQPSSQTNEVPTIASSSTLTSTPDSAMITRNAITSTSTIALTGTAAISPTGQPMNLAENGSFDSRLDGWTVSRCTQDPEIVGLPDAACIFPIGPLRRSSASKVALATGGESSDNGGTSDGPTVAQLYTESGSVRLRSSLMRVEPGSLVRFSVQAKAEKILDSGGWHKGGISLSIHDENGKKIRHYDFASFSGSFDWKKMNGELFVADEVQYVRLNLEIRQTTGTLLIDDVIVHAFAQPDFATIEKAALDGINQTKDAVDSASTETKIPVVTSPNPALPLRGAIAAGSWFNSPEILDRFQKARFNFAWTQGSFLSQKMQYLWREPLLSSDREMIRNWIDMCEEQSISCYLSLSPRGQSAAAGTIYSSQKEIDSVIKRFDALYRLGVRNFGLSFDDLHRFGQAELRPEDTAKFDHIGQAHAYFVGEIYKQLTGQYDDVQLMIVPLYYDLIGNLGSNEEAYLYSLAELPQEVGMLSSVVFVEDAKTAIRLTGRRHVVWDNQFAFAYENGGAGEYIAPLRRPQLDDSLIAGYSFLPLMKSREDAALVSWQSASNYAWSPNTYDPDHALERAITNYLGAK